MNNDIECSICLDTVQIPIYKNETTTRLICGHIFHTSCVLEWFEMMLINSCPYCRRCENDFYEKLRHEMDRVLVRYGMKNLKSKIEPNNFEKIWNWLFTEKQISFEYINIKFLIISKRKDKLQDLANESMQSLIKRRYFEIVENNYVYCI
jgi:hypothetical protein